MAKKSVTAEFKRQMVAFARSRRKPASLSKEFGPAAWTIALWAKQPARDAGDRDGGLSSAEFEKLKRLWRENQQLKEGREILSKSRGVVATEKTPTKRLPNS